MKKYFKLIIIISLLVNLSFACNLVDPTTRAQNFLSKGEFENGIKILEKEYNNNPNSVPIKSILARAYADYGLTLCQDENKPPKVKYPMAKEQLSMALALNPYIQEAKDMYEMIEKIQASLAKNMID